MARIQRLCCLGIGGEMLMPDLVREVMGLIPSRGGLFYWVGPNLKITNAYTTFSTTILELWLKEFVARQPEDKRPQIMRARALLRPLNEFSTWPVPIPVMRFEQQLRVARRAFLRSDYYNLLWRPVENCDPLMLAVREADRVRGVLQVYRAPGEPAFEPYEVKMLEAIFGFVAHGMTPARLEDDAFADSDNRALFIANLDGTVSHVPPQAQHLLMMALNPRRSPTANWRGLHERVPEIAHLCRTLAATANGEIGQPPPVLRLRNPWGEFALRAYWLGPTDGTEQTRNIGITIERRVPRALALHRRVEELPLTGREKQLCLLLASHDGSRQDLADTMGISAGTVITHQSSIYAKLDLHSRAELLTALVADSVVAGEIVKSRPDRLPNGQIAARPLRS